MQITAYAKINWSLAVTGRRPDGYHLLDSLMQTIDLGDTITITPSERLTLSVDGIAPTANPEDNLVFRAASLLQATAGANQGADIHLTKKIPTGAGLGGGSADAAAVLVALNKLWSVNLPLDTLALMAVQLGADVPFCLTGGLARTQGIGEIIMQLPSTAQLSLVILQPEGGLSTPAVFRVYDSLPTVPSNPSIEAAQSALLKGDMHRFGQSIGNALQSSAASLCPEISECITALYAQGAIRALITGSGSAVFGLFPDMESANRAAIVCNQRWKKCWVAQSITPSIY